jgi:hypothetical protein
MPEALRIGNRGKQILSTLFQNGPLSSSTLRAVIEPGMSVGKMNAAIRRLRNLGLVRNRHSSVSQHVGRFVELATGIGHRKVLSQVLDVPLEKFETIPGNTEALEHWQECTIWGRYFEKRFPGCRVIRDYELLREPLIQEESYLKADEADLLPDLIIRFPRTDLVGAPLYVGIEIERSRKSKKKLRQKLRRYAAQSRLACVLYICSRPGVAEPLTRVYTSRVRSEVVRVESYSENFLLISDGKKLAAHDSIGVKNALGSAFSFDEWIHFLRTRKMAERAGFYGGIGVNADPSRFSIRK